MYTKISLLADSSDMLFCCGFFEKSFENYGVLGNSINFKALAVLLVKPGLSFPNFGSNIQRI